MKVQQTVVLASVFSLGFMAIAVADFWVFNAQAQTRAIVLSAEDERLAEPSPKLAVSLDSQLLQQLQRHVLGGGILTEHEQLIHQTSDLQHRYVKSVVEQLVQLQQWGAVIAAAEQFTLEQRMAMQIQFRYAQVLAKQEVAPAIEAYQALLRTQPNHQAAAINVGLLLNKQQRYSDAQAALVHAVSISAGSRKAKALSALATSVKAQGDLLHAERLYDRSIQYRPQHAATWLKLANTRAELAVPQQQVVKTYQRALALQENYYRAAKALGLYLLHIGEFSAAIEHLEFALKGSREDESLHTGLAWAYTEQGQLNAARKQWQWIKHKAAKKSARLVAAHFDSSLSQKGIQLKALPSGEDFLYTKAVLAQIDNELDHAKQLLGQIPSHHPQAQRAQLRLQRLTANS